jgi:hypothetical protein
MFVKILIGLVVIVAVLAIVVALQPSDFRVERTATMSASPAAVFAEINDFHNWQAWNPWGKIDPAMKQTFEGAPAGPGAIYTWAGNNDVGEGRMTIIESKPNELVRVQLDFLKPFAATSTADFTIKPDGDKTAVTWSMYGKNNFMAKAIHLVMNMDKMIGGQFEKGLADMKTVAEASPKQ